MRRLAIIPARSGSKRAPGKNLRLLSGKPLLQHTVDVAADFFDDIVVSSDSEEILSSISLRDNTYPHLRPAELATDNSKVIDTVCYYYDKHSPDQYDQIWLCLPTCPLRTPRDLHAGGSILTMEVDGVISITEYEFPPVFSLSLLGGIIRATDPRAPLASGNSRSQDQPTEYRPNGAFYGMWWSSFSKHRNFYRGRIAGVVMPRRRSVDIDTELDFVIAEAVLRAGDF